MYSTAGPLREASRGSFDSAREGTFRIIFESNHSLKNVPRKRVFPAPLGKHPERLIAHAQLFVPYVTTQSSEGSATRNPHLPRVSPFSRASEIDDNKLGIADTLLKVPLYIHISVWSLKFWRCSKLFENVPISSHSGRLIWIKLDMLPWLFVCPDILVEVFVCLLIVDFRGIQWGSALIYNY